MTKAKQDWRNQFHSFRHQMRLERLEREMERMRVVRHLEEKFIYRFEDRIPRDWMGNRILDVDMYLWRYAAERVKLVGKLSASRRAESE